VLVSDKGIVNIPKGISVLISPETDFTGIV
jgi:hypothetical protein